MSRNSNSIVTSVPTSRKPRTKILFGPVDHITSSQHGRLTPNFIKPIFPGDTFNMKDFAGFAYADKSSKLPLQDIVYDQYFFFVPFRIIDKRNWEKVLGFKENPLDTTVYSIPQVTFKCSTRAANVGYDATRYDKMSKFCPHLLFGFLGYNLPDINITGSTGTNFFDDMIYSGSAYPLLAYWEIWNSFFRDENLDTHIDGVTALYNINNSYTLPYIIANASDDAGIMSTLEALHLVPEKINKLHDPLTSGMISPQKSPDGQPVTLFLGGAAPVVGINTTTDLPAASGLQFDEVKTWNNGQLFGTDNLGGANPDYEFYADLSKATAVDINALRLAFSIQSLYEAKGRFGSRYIEYIRGIWSVEVPDIMLDRPEYLGGVRLSMNNMPVLNTANNLGLFSGYSATLFNGCQFDKTFLEYGFIIGVHSERVRHVYSQGRDIDVWDKRVELDIYNPKFAELGFMGYPKDLLYSGDSSILNYNEAWTFERTQLPRTSGIFGPLGGSYYQEYREKWTYADYYASAPTFNADWLKESVSNVARTMTGELIVGANNVDYGFQYMFDFKFSYTITRIIPVYSTPADLGGRW